MAHTHSLITDGEAGERRRGGGGREEGGEGAKGVEEDTGVQAQLETTHFFFSPSFLPPSLPPNNCQQHECVNYTAVGGLGRFQQRGFFFILTCVDFF